MWGAHEGLETGGLGRSGEVGGRRGRGCLFLFFAGGEDRLSCKFGEGKLTGLADARQFRGCAGSGSGTDVPREGLLMRAMDQPQSLCREYPALKGSEVERTFIRVNHDL